VLSFTAVERRRDKLRRIQPVSSRPNVMTPQEREQVKREALLRALAIVQRYQDENWRRLRVNDICFEIKRLISEEATR
jgi:hypothetical protein